MSLSVVPDQDQVYQALVAYLIGVLPPGVPVFRELPNRASLPPPVPGFVAIQGLFTDRLRMAIDTYPQGTDEAPTNYTIEQGIEIRFQFDCFGKHSGSWASLISTTFQDVYGCNALAPNCQPLYCNEGRMIPLENEERQYEERWCLDAHLQWNPVVTVLQQYADELELTLKDVNVEFPNMSVNAIPASKFVASIPSVLSASGAVQAMVGIMLDQDPSIPIGTVQEFANQPAVAAWYGANSNQAKLAGYYFNGFDGAAQIPSALGFFQYNIAAVAGYMRGGSVAGLTLTQLQALSGTISVAIDGVNHVSANINLASASSFTAAAALLQTGLQTGTPTTTATVTYDALRKAFVITSGTTGVNSVVAFGTDASLSPQLNLTAALGAVESLGAAAQSPAGAMAAIGAATQNWASFMTTWDPDAGAPGGPIKLQFSSWASQQGGQYAYVAWDTDATPSTTANDAACYGALLAAAGYSGTIPIWETSVAIGAKAAFVMGAIASIDFTQEDGRVDFAYLSQTGLTPSVTSLTVYNNLVSNGYNCYCAVATKTQQFQFLQPGSMPGQWAWIDPYIDQLYFNALMQSDLLVYRTQIKWIPYTEAGYNGVRQALQPAIDQMGTFGAWAAGVQLSGAQIAEVNQQAGANIATTLQNQGWYLQITDPGAAARQARLSPNIYFWYTDGGNVNQLVVNSVDVE